MLKNNIGKQLLKNTLIEELVMLDIINNTSKLLGDDLKNEIKSGSKLRIAASCFSIYAYGKQQNLN